MNNEFINRMRSLTFEQVLDLYKIILEAGDEEEAWVVPCVKKEIMGRYYTKKKTEGL